MMTAKKKKTEEPSPSFEEQMARLEEIADELESGELGLEKAITRYEEGVKCYRECHKILSRAGKKVEILTRNAEGELETKPFEDEEVEAETTDAETPEDDADDDDATSRSLF